MDEEVKDKVINFFSDFKVREFKKNEILIQAYDDPKGIYFIEKGRVKMYFISKDGEEVVLNIFKPLAFFPMSWALNESKNQYFFETMEPTVTRMATKDEAVKFIKNNPDVILDLLKRVYKGTDGLLIRMAYLMSGSAYSRLVTELIIESKRFGEKKDNEIKLKISEKELAAETGMSRETISREIKKLKEKNLVGLKDKVLLLKDINKLEQELS